jgi:hypothetical protein
MRRSFGTFRASDRNHASSGWRRWASCHIQQTIWAQLNCMTFLGILGIVADENQQPIRHFDILFRFRSKLSALCAYMMLSHHHRTDLFSEEWSDGLNGFNASSSFSASGATQLRSLHLSSSLAAASNSRRESG